jgi:hypothetical protein
MTLDRGEERWEDSCSYASNGKGPEQPGISWWALALWCVLGSLGWVALLGPPLC